MDKKNLLAKIDSLGKAGDMVGQCTAYLKLSANTLALRGYAEGEVFLKKGKLFLTEDAPLELKVKYLIKEAIFEKERNEENGIALFEKAKTLLKSGNLPLIEAELFMEYGGMYQNYRKTHQAIEQYELALASLEKIEKSEVGLPEDERKNIMEQNWKTTMRLASAYSGDDLKNAIKYDRAALNLSREITWIPIYEAYSYRSLGLHFLYLEDWEQAEINIEKAITAFEKAKNLRRKFDAQNILCEILIEEKKYKEALPLLDESIEYFATHKDSFLLMEAYEFKAEIFDKTGEKKEALQSYSKLLEFYNSNKRKIDAISDLNHKIGLIHYENNDLKKAKSFLLKSAEIEEGNSVEVLKNAYEYLFKIEKEQRNYKTAVSHLEKFIFLKDSILNIETQEVVQKEKVTQNIEGAMESKEKAELEAQILASQNRLYGAIALGLLSVLLIGGYLFFQLRKTKQRIESQNLQLQQLNTTKDKFFGIIAHDIRSPIVALDGVGEQMDFYLKKNNTDKLQRLAGRVDSTAKRLSSLLDNLLNWALLQQGVIPYHPKTLKVKEVGESIFEMFKSNAAAKKITLELRIPENQKVHADESALNTILRNLVSNAIKFTPEGGTVSLSTEMKDDKVFIHVNDTGTGISAERISKLFSLEKKSKKGTAGEKGTGLGLTLVKELMELNKGSIDVKSALQKGTTFKLILPMIA